MSRTTWRALRTELVRGTGAVAAAAVAITGSALLFNETEVWAGRWAPLAAYMRVLLIVLVPLAVAAGAWQIGRVRRRRANELLGTTPRPDWQPVVLAWTAVTLGMWAGLALTWLSGAVLVAPVATYTGRGWWLDLLVAFIAVAAASALGIAVGRLIPSRLVAPIAGGVTFVAIGVADAATSGGSRWLFPNFGASNLGTVYLPNGFQLQHALWLFGLGAALLVVAAARHKWLALIPAAVAVAAAVPVANGTGYERWQPDPDASELVCADGAPEVCLTRVNSFLLDELTPVLRTYLARWEGVDGGFTRVVDASAVDSSEPVADDTLAFYLQDHISWKGGLSVESEYGGSIDSSLASVAYSVFWQNDCPLEGEQLWDVQNAAYTWAGGDDVGSRGPYAPGLLALPVADQKDWMGRYLAAARECDDSAFAELAAELR